ncbi:hypothetical protein F9C11_21605 [Amycolatopsis sp. VS8301801F10]|uniref:hypothetical protein n=1 Tax=Amycolatopsis sp. VS8301801F10 TaxID=2652442 RepID=UPI0038FD28C9
MRYDVQKLREATDKAIAAERVVAQKYYDEAVARYNNDLANWVTKYSEQWAQAARLISRKVRAGKPITRDDVPTSEYGHRTTFDARHPGDCPKGVSADLQIIRSALELITDETVTPTELAKLGVRASELRTVFSLARSDA